MSQKGARRCQSAFFLSPNTDGRTSNDNRQENNTRNAKRTREEIETPTIQLEDTNIPSDHTITPTDRLETNTLNNLQQPYRLERNWEAVKLDRLGDKIDRYHSHDEFLRKCVTNKVTPISYQINLEPSIGNHDEAFLKGCYDMLEGFSRDVMKYTAEYFQERIKVFEAVHETATKALSENNTGEVFTEIKKTLLTNQEKRKRALKEVKERKFIRLKYHSKTSAPRQTREQREQDTNTNKDRTSYAQAVRRKQSNQNISRRNNNRNPNQVRL